MPKPLPFDETLTGEPASVTGIVAHETLTGAVTVPLRFTVRDLGGTFGVECWIEDHCVFAQRARTGHASVALDHGVELLARALTGAVAAVASPTDAYTPSDAADLAEYDL